MYIKTTKTLELGLSVSNTKKYLHFDKGFWKSNISAPIGIHPMTAKTHGMTRKHILSDIEFNAKKNVYLFLPRHVSFYMMKVSPMKTKM